MNLIKMGQKISVKRKEKNMSLGDLADRTGFSSKSIVLVESGQAIMTLEMFAELCTALDIQPNDLLEGEYTCSTGAVFAGMNRKDVIKSRLQAMSREDVVYLKQLLGLQEENNDSDKASGIVKKDHDTVRQEIDSMIFQSRNEQKEERSMGKSTPRSSTTKRFNPYTR